MCYSVIILLSSHCVHSVHTPQASVWMDLCRCPAQAAATWRNTPGLQPSSWKTGGSCCTELLPSGSSVFVLFAVLGTYYFSGVAYYFSGVSGSWVIIAAILTSKLKNRRWGSLSFLGSPGFVSRRESPCIVWMDEMKQCGDFSFVP